MGWCPRTIAMAGSGGCGPRSAAGGRAGASRGTLTRAGRVRRRRRARWAQSRQCTSWARSRRRAGRGGNPCRRHVAAPAARRGDATEGLRPGPRSVQEAIRGGQEPRGPAGPLGGDGPPGRPDAKRPGRPVRTAGSCPGGGGRGRRPAGRLADHRPDGAGVRHRRPPLEGRYADADPEAARPARTGKARRRPTPAQGNGRGWAQPTSTTRPSSWGT